MSSLKTKRNDGDVAAFLSKIENDATRSDCLKLLEIMESAVGEKAKLWGDSMVGFGKYSYTYPSGHQGEWFLTGFSPRKQNLTLYIMSGFEAYDGLMQRLGKHKTGKSCLYVKSLADIDLDILKEMIKSSVDFMMRKTNYTIIKT